MRLPTLALLALLAACGGDDRRVPFGEEDDGETTPDDPGEPEGFTPREGRSFEPGAGTLSVEGSPLGVEGSPRALLALDLDEDGDRDALVVAETESELRLAAARREGDRFAPATLSTLELEGCAVARAGVRTVTEVSALAEAELRCEGDEAADPWRVRWVVGLGEAPRVRETVSTRAPLEAELAFEDRDEDGHEDLGLVARVHGAEVAFAWLDRPGGLAREAGEPEASVRAALDADPARGARLAAAFCRGEDARIRFGAGAWGLACPDALRERARRAEVAALLQAGELVDALAALEGGAPIPDDALDAAAASGIEATRLTRWRGTPDAATAHTALGFDADGGLIVRGVTAERHGPAGGVTPADALPAPVRDPGGRFFVRGLRRTCAGVEAELLPASQVGPGAGFAPAQRRPVAEAPLEGCTRPPESTLWRALGWAPQGLVVGRPGARWVAPLTADGLPAGDPVRLETGDPPPAPLQGGRVTPDGESWIVETPWGVLLTRRGRSELWRPAGWTDAPPPRAAALSQDGERVALLRGDEVFLLAPAGDDDAEPSDEPPNR